jgi:hypothetical protein
VFDRLTLSPDFSPFVFEEVRAHSVELASELPSIAITPGTRICDRSASTGILHFALSGTVQYTSIRYFWFRCGVEPDVRISGC